MKKLFVFLGILIIFTAAVKAQDCDTNIPPTLNFLFPSASFILTNPQIINWTWSDTDSYPQSSVVYLFYTPDGGSSWYFITALDPDSGLPSKGYGQYVWDTSIIFAMDPLPSAVSILGIIYDGCDVGLSDPSSGATQAGSGDPTDPYDLISGGGLVPEFTTIGLIAVLAVVVSLFIVQKIKKKKSKKVKKK